MEHNLPYDQLLQVARVQARLLNLARVSPVPRLLHICRDIGVNAVGGEAVELVQRRRPVAVALPVGREIAGIAALVAAGIGCPPALLLVVAQALEQEEREEIDGLGRAVVVSGSGVGGRGEHRDAPVLAIQLALHIVDEGAAVAGIQYEYDVSPYGLDAVEDLLGGQVILAVVLVAVVALQGEPVAGIAVLVVVAVGAEIDDAHIVVVGVAKEAGNPGEDSGLAGVAENLCGVSLPVDAGFLEHLGHAFTVALDKGQAV